MKSNKQRRLEIKAKRRKRAEALKVTPLIAKVIRPLNSVASNLSQLAHNVTWGPLPSFYVDQPFKCRECGTIETWKATSQKWWYEIAKGNIDSTAIHCRCCRMKRRKIKEEQKQHMTEMAKQKPHPHELFFKKRY